MDPKPILLRYHEIAIKGQNRRWFEERLAINARKMIQKFQPDTPVSVQHLHGRIILETGWDEQIQEALRRTFGISSFSPMRRVVTEKPAILEAALEEFQNYVQKHGLPKTFRVQTRRSDKAIPEPSMDIDRWIGSEIHDRFPTLTVDLKSPDFILGVEIRFKQSFIWLEKHRAEGGLPVGTNGKLLCLMSGGIDSPVAAIQAIRRGSPAEFVHFYGTPYVGPEALEKVEALVKIVNRYQPDPLPLHVIPFGKIQEKIALATSSKMRTLLYRRMMVRISNELATRLNAHALVTGESLGQVASQTVENMATINSVSKIPILRPLVAFDKDEIITRAQNWGSFDVSILPAADCCTLFADRHPVLRSTERMIEEQEAMFSVPDLVSEALAGIEVVRC